MKKAKLLGWVLTCALSVPWVTAFASDKSVAVERLFEVIDMDRQLSGGFEAMLPVIENMSSELELDASGKAELLDIYRAWFFDDIDRNAMLEKMVPLYADTFSLEELQDLIAFYQTPIGQKFLEVTPELTKQGAQIGMLEALEKQPLLLERLEPFMEARGKR